jgi:hypothetical protein
MKSRRNQHGDPLARLAEMIDKKLIFCSGGDAEVVEQRAHVESKGLVMAIELGPSGGLAPNVAWAYTGQYRADDAIAQD